MYKRVLWRAIRIGWSRRNQYRNKKWHWYSSNNLQGPYCFLEKHFPQSLKISSSPLILFLPDLYTKSWLTPMAVVAVVGAYQINAGINFRSYLEAFSSFFSSSKKINFFKFYITNCIIISQETNCDLDYCNYRQRNIVSWIDRL